MVVTHVLDLPNIVKCRDPSIILNFLEDVAPKKVKNFGGSTNDNDSSESLDQKGLFIWLTSLVASPLEWIDDEYIKEEIWQIASLRLSERCGRTAAPAMKREIEIALDDSDNSSASVMKIELMEPSLTEDSLGLKTWGSSLVIAKRLVREHNNLLRDPVLELGSGTGLSGIVAAKLGHEIWVTDLSEIVENLRVNVNLNCTNGEDIRVEVLDWYRPTDSNVSQNNKFNSILVSDPIYSPHHPRLVCNMIENFLNTSGDALVCIQLPLREKFEAERASFYEQLEEIGLIRLRYEVERGSDDFGDMNFAWSLWKWKEPKHDGLANIFIRNE